MVIGSRVVGGFPLRFSLSQTGLWSRIWTCVYVYVLEPRWTLVSPFDRGRVQGRRLGSGRRTKTSTKEQRRVNRHLGDSHPSPKVLRTIRVSRHVYHPRIICRQPSTRVSSMNYLTSTMYYLPSTFPSTGLVTDLFWDSATHRVGTRPVFQTSGEG